MPELWFHLTSLFFATGDCYSPAPTEFALTHMASENLKSAKDFFWLQTHNKVAYGIMEVGVLHISDTNDHIYQNIWGDFTAAVTVRVSQILGHTVAKSIASTTWGQMELQHTESKHL